MKMKLILLLFVSTLLFTTCSQTKDLVPTRTRQLSPAEISSYHQPVQLQVAWVPYENKSLVQTGKNEWKIIEETDGGTGAVPVLMVLYPDGRDTLWLDMNTENALLGKLVKHTLMTEEPIKRPFSEYFEVASCGKCHPSHVEINME